MLGVDAEKTTKYMYDTNQLIEKTDHYQPSNESLHNKAETCHSRQLIMLADLPAVKHLMLAILSLLD